MRKFKSNKKPLLIVVIALLCIFSLGIQSRDVFADGTETLGLPSIPIASGTGIVAAGTGLSSQPGTIDIKVPDGATINQVLLYWEGQMIGDLVGDNTIVVNGTEITGTPIGGQTFFFGNVFSSSFRADITEFYTTSFGVISDGLIKTLTAQGLNFTNLSNGAGVLVIFDNGTTTSNIQIRDGIDLAFINFSAARGSTIPQLFTFAPSTFDRVASLSMFFSSIVPEVSALGFRPSAIVVSVDGGPPSVFNNQLNSVDGAEWDTLNLDVDIPGGATSLTVQALSQDNDPPFTGPGGEAEGQPASLSWIAAGLSVPPEPSDCCPRCPDGKKIKLTTLRMLYTGEDCSATSHSQDCGKADCEDDCDPLPDQAYIVASSKPDPGDKGYKEWFAGFVNIGEEYVIDAATGGESHLKNTTFVSIFRQPGGERCQLAEFHTSCSQDLFTGDQFGASILLDCTHEEDPCDGDGKFNCKDIKPITSLNLIWNGPGPVDIVSEGGQVINGINPGEVIELETAGLGNDVDVQITGDRNGSSRFHVSCSDQEMNGPEDCGSSQGNGKDNQSGLNLWIFEGMAGNLTLDCNP